MHPADIKARLVKAGHPPSKVAQTLEVSQATVSQVIHAHCSSRRVAKYISKVIRTPVNTIWPDGRYARGRRGRAAA